MAGKIIRPDDWDEGTLFHAPLHREPDQPTSVQGAKDVKHRRTSQAMLLLIEYRNHDLTNKKTKTQSNLIKRSRCYWKRCSDLRSAGYIVNTGKTRIGSAGSAQMICAITPEGLKALD